MGENFYKFRMIGFNLAIGAVMLAVLAIVNTEGNQAAAHPAAENLGKFYQFFQQKPTQKAGIPRTEAK